MAIKISKSAGNAAGFGIGGFLAVVIGSIIAWGQLRGFLPQRQAGYWPAAECGVERNWPVPCLEPGVPPEVEDGIQVWRDLGYAMPPTIRKSNCGVKYGQISFWVDQSLDEASGPADDGTFNAGGDIEFTESVWDGPVTWGRTAVYDAELLPLDMSRCWTLRADGVVIGCALGAGRIALHPRADGDAPAHELGHALGFLHGNALPVGNLMNSDANRVGKDTRGLQCGEQKEHEAEEAAKAARKAGRKSK